MINSFFILMILSVPREIVAYCQRKMSKGDASEYISFPTCIIYKARLMDLLSICNKIR